MRECNKIPALRAAVVDGYEILVKNKNSKTKNRGKNAAMIVLPLVKTASGSGRFPPADAREIHAVFISKKHNYLRKPTMKLITQLPIMVLTLGMSMAHAQTSQSTVASPFGNARPASPGVAQPKAAVMSKAQALAALSPVARKKVSAGLLDAVLDGEKIKVLVLFKDQSNAAGNAHQAQRLSMQMNAFSATRQSVRAALSPVDGVFLHEYTYLPLALVEVYSQAALVNLLNHPNVAKVAENLRLEAMTAQSLPLIHQPEAVATGRRGAGTTVAVLDTGGDISQAAFGSCTSVNTPASCRIVETVDVTGDGFDSSPTSMHGTMVAGAVAQVAPGAKIALLDVHKAGGGAEVADMLKGIDWAIGNQARYNIVAFNLSVGTADLARRCTDSNAEYAALSSAYAYARAVSILPVIAAGNNHASSPGERSFPACAAGGGASAVVAAVYDEAMFFRETNGFQCSDSNAQPNGLACFSNRGSDVTIAAPGAVINIGNRHSDSGTSFAAPHVAGAIAVLRAPDAAPGDTLAQTMARLRNTGYDVSKRASPSTPRIPRLDLMASLNSVSHLNVAQQFYVSLFGRPADPAGLAWFIQSLKSIGAPSAIVELNAAYDSNAQLRSLVDSMGSGAESLALYPGDNTAYVTALYQNILNRSPDSGGLAFWKGVLDAGAVTRGRLALTIAASAMASPEGAALMKKAAVATNFTKALDLETEMASYQRSTAEARTLLRQVDLSTYVDDMDGPINNTISIMLNR